MSDDIKHECGIAHVRLLKDLDFYKEKYGSHFYGLQKTHQLMTKMQNRGQDGAGIASIKLNMAPGYRYISRARSKESSPTTDLFKTVYEKINAKIENKNFENTSTLKKEIPFLGEVYMGHVRYGTYGGNSIENVHPFIRQNNWITRNLLMAGNFNMTNVEQLFEQLLDLGQQPKELSDTVTVMENIGHFLDDQVMEHYYQLKDEGYSKRESSEEIGNRLDIQTILQRASKKWDGGYVMCGMIGHGDSFVFRDPKGIRPAFYYIDEEQIVVASERAPIQSCFKVHRDTIKELPRGHALIIKKDASHQIVEILPALEKTACSFERIYFSRGNDASIYQERQELGRILTPDILKSIDHDLKNTVFSFIPNTAETAFFGMVKGINEHIDEEIAKMVAEHAPTQKIQQLLTIRPRVEKVVHKDAKVRTFISQDSGRNDLVSSAYDITYGVVEAGENLVLLDDSIVRGTTLQQSILQMVDRLQPKKIVVVSSAPQIRYPDCYGIDMAKIGDFIAFQAAIALLKKTGKEKLIDEVYELCKNQADKSDDEIQNYVRMIYEPFSAKEISNQIASMIKGDVKAEVEVIYQSLENLHSACPEHLGDWYFSGKFPTPGGMRVLNKAFVNYYEGNNGRSY